MADENDGININVGVNASSAEAGSRRARTAIKGISDEGAALQAMYRRMQASIDPAYAAMERYNKSFRENQQLFAAGIITGQEFAAANRAAAAALNEARTAVERNSAAYKEQQAAQKAAAAQEAADARSAAAAVRAAAAEKAAAEKQAAADARAAQIAARAAEREEIRAVAAEAKLAAKQKAADEKAASQAIADAERTARQAQKQAARDAAAASKQAAQDKAIAERAATSATNAAAEATRRQAIEERSLAQSEQQLRASIDPVYAAQMRYNQTMQQATTLLMNNRLATGEFARIQQNARTQMDLNTRSLGRQNTAYVNIGYQIQDVVASSASGISPLVILAQQGGQTASAVAQMGGRFAGVASFIAGPWGAAILGAVVVLGMLIPKLLGAASAADQMKVSQENLKNYIDSTTGSINAQVTATQRLAAAKNEADQSERTRKQRDAGVTQLTTKLQLSTVDLSGPDAPGLLPAAITNPRSVALIQKWSEAVKAGTLPVENLAIGLRNLSRQDPAVAKLYGTLQKNIAATQDLDMAARKTDASQRLFNGTATDADRKLIGVAGATKEMSTSYLDAQAVLKTSTDAVDRATAAESIAKDNAARARTKNIAAGMAEAKANEIYVTSVAPAIAATKAAQNAKSAASKQASADRKAAAAEERDAHKMEIEEMRWQVELAEAEKGAAENSYSGQVAAQQKKIAILRAYYGDWAHEVERAQRELEQMERKHNDAMLARERERIAAQQSIDEGELNNRQNASKTGLDVASDTLDTKHTLGMVDGRPLIEARRAILAEQYRMEQEFEQQLYDLKLKSLNDQLALLPKESDAYAQMQNQIVALTASHDNTLASMATAQYREVNKLNLQAVENTASKWHTITDSVSQSFSQMFQGIWMHTGNFKADLLNVADQIVFKFVDMGLKIASDWAANELAKTAKTLLGVHVRTAAEVAGETTKTAAKGAHAATRTGITAAETGTELSATAAKTGAAVVGETVKTGAKVAGTAADTAMTVTSATTEIGARAATSAAGAFSSTVVIPFIGPVAAPVAAAAALAAVLGFTALISAKGGMGEVPGDQLAMVHKKEMILPAWIAEPLRASLKVGAPASAGLMGSIGVSGAEARAATHMSSVGGPTFNYQPNHTNMGAGFDELLRRDSGSLRKWIRNQARNGAFKVS
jgi:hypothetical protein